MPYARGIPAALTGEGLSVELVPGWETRGREAFNPAVVVCHWTAGPKAGDRPSLRVCVEGLPGLPGPLCQVFLTRGGVAVVVAAGRANHAGVGGWKGVVGNSGAFGIEAESAGDGDWTAAQLDAYPRVVAALCRVAGTSSPMVCGHNEWAQPKGRKVDIRDWPMPRMRAQVDAILTRTHTPDDEGDTLTPDQARMLQEIHDALMPGRANHRNEGYVRQQARLAREAAEAAAAAVQAGKVGEREAGHVVRQLAAVQAALAAGGPVNVDAQALADALVAAGIGEAVVDAIRERLGRK